MSGSLETLLAEGIISDVVARLKSGKEADVYVVTYQGREVAAKVYKDHATRSFKNNASYKEGRSVRSSRGQRAIDRGTKFGREAAEEAWKSAEVDALYKLHAGGVRVPTPVMFFEGVLLMELVRDAEGAAARRVIDVPLTVEDANRAYYDMLGQIVRILCCDLIHGDLSPYNVLWAASGPTIIDFPQSVSAPANSRAEFFFIRDAHNILGHFAAIDRTLDARVGDAAEIWRTYVRRELSPDFLPRGRPLRMAPPRRPDAPRPQIDAPRPHADAPRPHADAPRPHADAPRPHADAPRPHADAPRPHAEPASGPRDADQAPAEVRRPPRERGPRPAPGGDRPRAFRDGPPAERPRHEGGQHEQRPRHDGPPRDARPRHDGPPRDARPRHDGPPRDARPRHDGGPPHRGPRRDGPPPQGGGFRRDAGGPPHRGPRPEGGHQGPPPRGPRQGGGPPRQPPFEGGHAGHRRPAMPEVIVRRRPQDIPESPSPEPRPPPPREVASGEGPVRRRRITGR